MAGINRRLRNGLWSLALAVPVVCGCTERDSSPAVATRIILPGEQQLTPPVVEQATASGEPAADAAAAQPATTQAQDTASAAAATPPTSAAAPAATPAPSQAATSATAAAETTGTEFAAFRGRITVAGTPPRLSPLVAKGDPKVKDAVCVAQEIPDESVIVGPDGGLADVFVFAKKLPSGVKAAPPPTEPAVIDQKNCRFIPRAMVLRVGQPLLLKNSDPVSHNVRTAGFAKSINQIVSPNDQTGIEVKYERPERLPVQTRCDIHAWMLAYHFPLDHPYAAVTGEDGTFEIADLPAGDWEFVIWHGRAGYIEKSYKFKAQSGQVVSQDFSVPASKLSP